MPEGPNLPTLCYRQLPEPTLSCTSVSAAQSCSSGTWAAPESTEIVTNIEGLYCMGGRTQHQERDSQQGKALNQGSEPALSAVCLQGRDKHHLLTFVWECATCPASIGTVGHCSFSLAPATSAQLCLSLVLPDISVVYPSLGGDSRERTGSVPHIRSA